MTMMTITTNETATPPKWICYIKFCRFKNLPCANICEGCWNGLRWVAFALDPALALPIVAYLSETDKDKDTDTDPSSDSGSDSDSDSSANADASSESGSEAETEATSVSYAGSEAVKAASSILGSVSEMKKGREVETEIVEYVALGKNNKVSMPMSFARPKNPRGKAVRAVARELWMAKETVARAKVGMFVA